MRLFHSRLVRAADVEGAAPAAATGAPAAPDTTTDAPAAPVLPPTLLSAEPSAEADNQTEQDAKAEPTKAEPTKAEPLNPEDYKIDVPTGIDADDPLLTAFLEGAAKGGMDNDSVQAVISTLGPKLAEQIAAPMKAWIATNEAWQAEVKADPIIGGANLPATVKTISDALHLFSDQAEATAFREMLTATGAGNHPAAVRVLHKWASRLTEKGAVQGTPAPAARDAATLLYGEPAASRGAR